MFKFSLKCVLRLIFFITTLTMLISGIESNNTEKLLIRYNDVIFYDLQTNQTLLPPIVTPLKYTQSSRLPLLRRPCSCQALICGCCAGMNIRIFNFNRHLCTNFTYDPNEFSIQMDVMLNENNLYTNMISAKNPSPLCIPVPIPFISASTEICVKMFNIFTPGRNLHMCMDMQMKVQNAPFIVLHFDCMRMGQDGLALVKPDQNGGLDVTTPVIEIPDQGEIPGQGEFPGQVEIPDQGEIPNQETVPQIETPESGSFEPPQVDYETYDEVTEIKVNN